MQDLLRRKEDEYVDWVKWREQVDGQLRRLISDADSEKGTRARVNSELDKKFDLIFRTLSKQNGLLYMILGGIIAANAIVLIAIELFKSIGR